MDGLPRFFAFDLLDPLALPSILFLAVFGDLVEDFQFLFGFDDGLAAEKQLLFDDSPLVLDLSDFREQSSGVITARRRRVDVYDALFRNRPQFIELPFALREQVDALLIELVRLSHDVGQELFAQVEPMSAHLANRFEREHVRFHDRFPLNRVVEWVAVQVERFAAGCADDGDTIFGAGRFNAVLFSTVGTAGSLNRD